MPNCDFNKVVCTLRHGCSPVNLLPVFRTSFPRNTSVWHLLDLKDHYKITKDPVNTELQGRWIWSIQIK